MDQEKIGKFIKKCREELGLTQKELAEQIFISDKTISKWEKGRGLMDITMLKPLSKILKVTIPELINGDYIKKESEKDDILDKTFKEISKKHKCDISKTIVFVLLVPIIIYILIFSIYKICLINKYTIKEDKKLSLYLKSEEQSYLEVEKHVAFTNNNIIKYGNFYITDNFKDFVYKEPNDHPTAFPYNPYSYIKYDKNSKVTSGLMFVDRGFSREIDELLDNYSKEALKEHKNKDTYYLDKEEIYSYFAKHQINTDIDLIKHCRNSYYFENSIFKSLKSIKENRTFNRFCYDRYNMKVQYNITYLTGGYEGFILDIEPQKVNPDIYGIDYKSTFENLKRRDLYILHNNRYYIFTFFGNELTTDDYIKNFISGLWIIY